MIAGLRPYPAYRDSGVAWLGHIPEHWRTVRAKWLFAKVERSSAPHDDVVTCFRDGTVTRRKNRRESGFTESLKELGYQGVRRGDLVIHAMDAFAGACGVSDSDGKSSPVYSVCTPRDKRTNSHYFASLVREMARSQWILALARGVRERSTDFRFLAFADQVLPEPPTGEQDAIVRLLDGADRRIRRTICAKEKRIALLEERKQAIIHRAVSRGLDPTISSGHSANKEPDQPPVHWRSVTLRAVAESIQTGPFGSQLHQSEYVTGGVPVVNPAHLANGRIEASPNVTVTDEKARQLKEHRLRPGDVVMARRGEMGRCAVVTEENADWLCGTGSIRIRPDASCLMAPYLVSVLGSVAGRRTLTEAAIGTTMNNLSARAVGSVRLALPPTGEQRAIADYLNKERTALDEARCRIREQIERIKEYRTRLIADVVTGKLDVREAAAALPDQASA